MFKKGDRIEVKKAYRGLYEEAYGLKTYQGIFKHYDCNDGYCYITIKNKDRFCLVCDIVKSKQVGNQYVFNFYLE